MAMPEPTPEEQLQFLFKVQRLLSEGAFVSTYKYALLVSLADLSVAYGDDTVESLSLSTQEIAEKFIALYWRQVLPWVAGSGLPRRLHQAAGERAAILDRIAREHERYSGSLARLRQDRQAWQSLRRDIARVVSKMPLWKLQTVGGQKLDFLYPNVGQGQRIALGGHAVYCFRRFHGLIVDLAESAWVRFIRRLRPNRAILGESDLRTFLFGSERSALETLRPFLRDFQSNRCFYCEEALRGETAIDHFIPWSLYPLDLPANLVLADHKCNGHKSDRLAAFSHLERWSRRNASSDFRDVGAQAGATATSDPSRSVARWAYSQAEKTEAQVWSLGKDGLVKLEPRWREVLSL